MSKRKAKRLYAAALNSYREGFIAGAQAFAWQQANPKGDGTRGRLGRLWAEDSPAYAAGYDAGSEGKAIDQSRLPLGLWVRVLAKDMEP